jgi:LAO/AO transport system kinase
MHAVKFYLLCIEIMNWNELSISIKLGDVKSLARAITAVENDISGYFEFLKNISINRNIPIIGITGPPGAGKSTLVNSILKEFSAAQKRVGVIAIDPTSPFHYGSLLGDRIRMVEHFTNPNVFIRSLATRGSLGGLSAKTIEITDVMRAFPFDVILVETVGVGQSEVEIVGLADTTVLVLVPEAGDEIQGIKSGIMEIADIFVVNKADREGAEVFVSNLKKMLHERSAEDAQALVVKTIASQNIGTAELVEAIYLKNQQHQSKNKKGLLLAEKAFRLIQSEKMKNVNKKELVDLINKEKDAENFNLYKLIEKYF